VSLVLPASLGIAKFYSRILSDQKEGELLGIVHIDSATTEFTIVNSKTQVYVRSIPLGATHLLAEDESERLKFIEELKKTLDSYQAESIEALPTRIIITGIINSSFEAIAGKIRDELKVETEFLPYTDANLMAISDAASEVLSQNQDVSFLDVISGAAAYQTAEVNLLPEEVKMRKKMQKKGKESMKVGIFALAILVLMCVALILSVYFNKNYLISLTQDYAQETETATRLTKLAGKSGFIKSFLNSRGKSLTVLMQVLNKIPDQIYLNNIVLSAENSIILKGTADSKSLVFSFITDLENDPHFQNVELDFTKSRKEGKVTVEDFGLTMQLEGQFQEKALPEEES